MSTRSVIARPIPGGDGFAGRYHHFDGYPSGVGEALYALYNSHFQRDAEMLLRVLVDDHPAGWSTICGMDFSLASGFVNHNEGTCMICGHPSRDHYRPNIGGLPLGHHPREPENLQPRCYCHGDRHEEAHLIMSGDSTTWAGIEYAYVINAKTSTMHVYWVQRREERFKLLAIVDLNGPEPDWEAMDDFAE